LHQTTKDYTFIQMRAKGTKYDPIDKLPANARPVSVYAADNEIRQPAYVYTMYDRFLAGTGRNPGFTIRCWQGMNFVLPA
jgi:hypothetical protein